MSMGYKGTFSLYREVLVTFLVTPHSDLGFRWRVSVTDLANATHSLGRMFLRYSLAAAEDKLFDVAGEIHTSPMNRWFIGDCNEKELGM
jgi:hypothetical protein